MSRARTEEFESSIFSMAAHGEPTSLRECVQSYAVDINSKILIRRGFDASILVMPKNQKNFGIISRYINFCCLIAKNFIWICRSKECFPIHNNFLFYLRHIYHLENKTQSNVKKWKPFFSSLGLVS